MKSIQVELFTEPTNNAVVRLPNRRFPGVLVQGDALYTLLVDADELASAASHGADAELAEIARAHRDNLMDLLEGYEQALKEHGMTLPYVKRATE